MSLPTFAHTPGGAWLLVAAALSVVAVVIWLARHHHPLLTAPLVLLGLITVGVTGAQGFSPAEPNQPESATSSSTEQGAP